MLANGLLCSSPSLMYNTTSVTKPKGYQTKQINLVLLELNLCNLTCNNRPWRLCSLKYHPILHSHHDYEIEIWNISGAYSIHQDMTNKLWWELFVRFCTSWRLSQSSRETHTHIHSHFKHINQNFDLSRVRVARSLHTNITPLSLVLPWILTLHSGMQPIILQ